MNESFKTDPSLATSARAAKESGSYLCASNVTPTVVRFIVSVFLCVLCFCRMSSTQMTCSHFRKNRPKKRQKPAGCRSRIISKNRPVPIFGRSTGASLVITRRRDGTGAEGLSLTEYRGCGWVLSFFFFLLAMSPCHQIKTIVLNLVNNTNPSSRDWIMAVEQWKSCCCCVWHFPWFHVIVSRQSHPEHFLKSFSYSFFHCLSVFSQPLYYCWSLVKTTWPHGHRSFSCHADF